MINSEGLSLNICHSKPSNCTSSDKNRHLLSTNHLAQMRPEVSSSRRELISESSETKLQSLSKIGTKFFNRTNMCIADIAVRTISREETKRKTAKMYHPIIRLLSSAKFSLQLLTILTIVPIKPIYLQLIDTNNSPISIPQYQRAEMLNSFPFIGNQNQDWAKRMLKASNDLQLQNHHPQQQQQQQQHQHQHHQQQQQHILSRFSPNQASLVAELRDGQSIYRPNVRQTLLADFVANQGQRILKNLVNNTIGDIVSQSAIRLATRSLIPQGQQFLLQQLQLQQQQQQQQQQQPPTANYQMLPNENLNNRYFPTVGKLYTLLFPNNQPTAQQSLVTTLPPATVKQTPNKPSSLVEAIQSSSSNNQNMYLRSRKESPVLQAKKNHPNKGTFQEKQVVNLIAPYDSRPRKSITSLNSLPSSSEQTLSHSLSQSDVSRRPRRDKSHLDEQRRLNQRPSAISYDQVQESVGDEVVSGQNGALPAGLDPELMSQFETPDLLQSNQKMPEEQQESQVNSTKDNHFDGSHEQTESQQTGEQPNDMQRLTLSSDFSGYFGARKNYIDNQEQRDQTNSRDLANEAHTDSLINQDGLQNQEPIERHTNHIEGADYLMSNENQPPSEPTQDEDGNLNQSEMHLIDQQQQQQQQAFENTTSDKRDIKVGQLDTSMEGLANSNSESEKFKTSLVNDTQNDESFLTAKLPSQYDAVIRMPPEGYYDDYFKPVSSNVATQTSASLLNPEGNGISEYPTISQTPPKPVRDQSEPFEIEPENSTNRHLNNSSSQQNHNFQDSNQANFIPLSMDYVKQFYSSQQSIKPNEANVEHSIEISPQVNQTASSNNKTHEIINYELPTAYDNYQNDSHASNHPAEMNLSNSRNNGHKFVHTFDDANNRVRNSSTNSHYQDQNEDSIQVIIANTNSSRDPVSFEKVINYTSDGKNITGLAGKPARNTFVNKDMNEFPPADEQNYQKDIFVNSMMPEKNLIPQQQVDQTGVDQNQYEDDSLKQQLQAPSFTFDQQPQSQLRSESLLPAQSNEKMKSQTQLKSQSYQSAMNESDDDRDINSRPETDNDTNEIRRLTNKQARNSNSNSVDESIYTVTMSPKMDINDNMSRDYHFKRNNNMNPVVKDRRDENERENSSENRKRPRAQNVQKYSINHPKMSKNNQNHRANRLNKQQTIRRPQVTQAHFDPKDLIAHAPTPSPSVTESTIESITELPAKLKRLKDNQPDKNELMNELLTALDRVKVAIYKLQPLTAKMNAIYRKSVTSNTRDIVMDNHKGTYAKRYPPGDYDDTYDRMHPSELIARDRSSNAHTRGSRSRRTNGGIEANESTSKAVYLPAPKEILESYERNFSASIKETPVSKSIIEIKNLGESQIVATGIGRRLGDGRVRGELDVNSGVNFGNEDRNVPSGENVTSRIASSEEKTNRGSGIVDSAAPEFVPVEQLLEDPQSPLFGYRITIYQSPEEDEADVGDVKKNRERFSYSTEGQSNFLDYSNDDNGFGDNDTEIEIETETETDSNSNSTNQESKSTSESTKHLIRNEDSMATSESSLVEQQQQPTTSPSSISDSSVEDAEPEESESKKKEEKKSSSEREKEKKSHKEQGKKKKEGSKKSSSKKKKQEEEKKKKKEYKKIKHDKKVVSKEKKSMKRDKHIKAHDRGAAKEKALKERTQIEFFEREQIVDDEFEKGKKSTVKANWEIGHDSKKTMKDTSRGDPMSVGGSHHIAHHVKSKDMEKGSGVKLAASSAKKSNKFEKKNMDAKGKKFKGWREKGYKIITETEFIDRGSLHDSAYKKRDKGAAHHQKYKKHQASSEGHHGSMHIHHKKLAKEEKKKSKMHEKKSMNEKKSEKEGNKHEKKSGKKKKEKSDDKQSAASSGEPVEVKYSGDEEDTLEGKESVGNFNKQPSFQQPALQTVDPNAFLTSKNLYSTNSNSAMTRLLNENHHEELFAPIKGDDYSLSTSSNSSNTDHSTPNSTIANKLPEVLSLTKYRPVESAGDEANRRADNPTARAVFVQRLSPLNFQNISSSLDKSNSTILDIVDNLTGRQINKANIGTYELEDHHNFNNRALNNSFPGISDNSSLNALKQINGAKFHPTSSQVSPLLRNSSNINADSNNNAAFITTTTRPQIINKIQSVRQQLEDDDEEHLLSVLHRAQELHQMGQENQNEVVQTLVSARQQKPYHHPPTSYLNSEQAKVAANLLHFLQQANKANRANNGPTAPSNQHASFLESNLVQNRNQSQATSFIPPQIFAAHQATRHAIFNDPAHANHYVDSTGLRTFRNDQFLDYEQDPLSRSQQTFIIG